MHKRLLRIYIYIFFLGLTFRNQVFVIVVAVGNRLPPSLERGPYATQRPVVAIGITQEKY
jgi:hypothetical protein